MFTEFLDHQENTNEFRWIDIMPGIRSCRFRLKNMTGRMPVSIVPGSARHCLEVLFCTEGSLMIAQDKGTLSVCGGDILLLSDNLSLQMVKMTAPIGGVLLSADIEGGEEGLGLLSRCYCGSGLRLDRLRTRMGGRSCCGISRPSMWSQCVFAALDDMSDETCGRYCLMKAAELLFLMAANSPLIREENEPAADTHYLVRLVGEIRDYMEHHLDEKLTIDALSRMFQISPTALKSSFRHVYGQPIHRWLQSRRIRRAAELLYTSPLTVLQIAQSVGYEGVSQFNVAFRQMFGMSPREYRKMSEPMEF